MGRKEQEQVLMEFLFALLCNFAIFIALFFLIMFRVSNWFPCIPVYYATISISLLLFSFAELLLLRLPSAVANINLFGVIEIKDIPLVTLTRSLKIKIKEGHIWLLFIISFIVVVPIFFPTMSLFNVSETPPIITGFDIVYANGETRSIQPGSEVQVKGSVDVEAKVIGGYDANSCKWSSSVNGSIIQSSGLKQTKCQVHYTSPEGDIDVLTITVKSACKIFQTSSTLCINTPCSTP